MTEPSQLAHRLRAAYHNAPIPPLRDALSPDDGNMAYEIQNINTKFWQDQGRKIIGCKVGLTAKAVQKQLGVNQPDFGILFKDMQIMQGGVLNPDRVIQPKAEAEIALILSHDLNNPTATLEDIIAATATACAAIEIVDSRIADWKITFADTVADNGSSAFFVLSDDKKTLENLDLWSCGMVLEINGETVSLGAGAACLGHPLEAAAWLARTLAKNGQTLKAGDIIMTGALGPMVPLKIGDHVKTTIGGIGSCEFRYGSR